MRRRMEGICFRNAFAGGIIHEAKSEIKGTPESIPSDYLDIGNIAGVRECRYLFPEYKRQEFVYPGFLVIYLLVMTTLLYKNKPVIMNEFINFATQYGQIQRRLLRDLELPYVLMDDDGKIIWTNAAFEQVVHKKRKGIRKQSIPFYRNHKGQAGI